MSQRHHSRLSRCRQLRFIRKESCPDPGAASNPHTYRRPDSNTNRKCSAESVDWKIPARGFHVSIYPAVLGSDIAGVVSAIGPDVKNFKVSDRAMCQGDMLNPDKCAFQQYMVVSSIIACNIPENITNDEASTVCVASIAARVSLFHETGLAISPPFWPGVPSRKRSDMILITGGSTSVGQYCIQFCVLAGFKRILTTAALRTANS
ncbi:uncharacterized protein BDZ99DRAFT_208991 [Mytilinidion resinicola]|uniref:Alcohol dehydrogenase-like N-terminal domain-containing protein n=1 Tax=Mytilinidion resinicola TaxID=574789 RepID=A0A6A6Y0J8_9PEZI|nr:uncharacterized protein BDZ99DRAFT_208991 [Mytilinidion resinicola]KAF2802078.1 hypothetical protein BDZ99DRAFT_208991 [Mytilinidion resinicola]